MEDPLLAEHVARGCPWSGRRAVVGLVPLLAEWWNLGRTVFHVYPHRQWISEGRWRQWHPDGGSSPVGARGCLRSGRRAMGGCQRFGGCQQWIQEAEEDGEGLIRIQRLLPPRKMISLRHWYRLRFPAEIIIRGYMTQKERPVLTLFTKFVLEQVDITLPENKAWYDRYKYDIPVFHLNGQFLMMHRVNLKKLEMLLSKLEQQDGEN
ncbi:glutaredoxin-like protein C5orf63 homolog isoform X2 [Hyperolius riggenbachi]|uniref:glutaredoxin-like protein C5orf63 homolog isoform X2 n=1 Tax=Hyperolius riggenbachi TaxID=752182 RepID=UPI0035A37FBF